MEQRDEQEIAELQALADAVASEHVSIITPNIMAMPGAQPAANARSTFASNRSIALSGITPTPIAADPFSASVAEMVFPMANNDDDNSVHSSVTENSFVPNNGPSSATASQSSHTSQTAANRAREDFAARHRTVRADFEQQLMEIYQFYNPSRIADIPNIRASYFGREQHLLDQLHIKYGGAISMAHIVTAPQEEEVPTAQGATLLAMVLDPNDDQHRHSGRQPIQADVIANTNFEVVDAEASAFAYALEVSAIEHREEPQEAVVAEVEVPRPSDLTSRESEVLQFRPSASTRASNAVAEIQVARTNADSDSDSNPPRSAGAGAAALGELHRIPEISRTWSNSSLSTLGTVATAMESGQQNLDETQSVSSMASSYRGNSLNPQSTSSFSASISSRRAKSSSGSVSVSRSLANTLPEDLIVNRRSALGKDPRKPVFTNTFDSRLNQSAETRSATKRQSIAMQQQSSAVKAEKLVDQTHSYLGCEELQILSCEIIPVMLSETVRYNCLKCTKEFKPPFRFKYHCKCCGDLYCGDCASYKMKLNLVPRPEQQTPELTKLYSKEVRICDYCLRHLSTGDLNSVLRYFGIIRDPNTSDAGKVPALHALYKSVEYEEVKEAKGMLRGNHLYPAFYRLIKQIGGFDVFWPKIVDLLTEGRLPDVRDYAAKIVAGVVQRISSFEDAAYLFNQSAGKLSCLQMLITALSDKNDSVILSSSYAIFRICQSFSASADMLIHFQSNVRFMIQIFTVIIKCSDNVRGYLKQAMHILLSNDKTGRVIDRLIESRTVDNWIPRIAAPTTEPAIKTIIISVISDIFQSLAHSEHYERTVTHFFDLGLLRECSKLLNWTTILRLDSPGETPPTPQFLITTPEYAALSLVEVLSESNVSHESMISGAEGSVCCLVMQILTVLCKEQFEESGAFTNESWQRIVSQALSFELNMLSCEEFNDMIPFNLCRNMIQPCLHLLQVCTQPFIVHQCVAVLSHFPFSTQFGEIILFSPPSSRIIVETILKAFKISCTTMKVISVTMLAAASGESEEGAENAPKFTASDMPAFHLLASVMYYSYVAHCVSLAESSILLESEKATLRQWSFATIYETIASNDSIWDLVLHYMKHVKEIIITDNESREEQEERCLPVLQFLHVFIACKGPITFVNAFQKKMNALDLLRQLFLLAKDSNFSAPIAEATLLCIGSACGAPPHFPWEEELLLSIGDRMEKVRLITQNELNSPVKSSSKQMQFGNTRNMGTSETVVSAYEKAQLLFSQQRANFEHDLGGVLRACSDARALQSVSNFNKGNCLATQKELEQVLSQHFSASVNSPETCLAALRIAQCLIREPNCTVNVKELILRSKLEFAALLTSYQPAAIHIADILSCLVRDEAYLPSIGRYAAPLTWALKITCQHASGSMLRVDPLVAYKAFEVTQSLALIKDCHTTIANEFSSLITDVLLLDRTKFLLNENVNTESLLRAALRTVFLLSDDVQVSPTVQKFMTCLLELIPSVRNIIAMDRINPEAKAMQSRSDVVGIRDLHVTTIFTLAQTIRFHDSNLRYMLRNVHTITGQDVFAVLFKEIEGLLTAEDLESLRLQNEVMLKPQLMYPDMDTAHAVLMQANTPNLRAQLVEGSPFYHILETLHLLVRAKMASGEGVASITRTLNAMVLNDHSNTAYLVYRMLLKAWAYGPKQMSDFALTVLARALAGYVKPLFPLLEIENLPAESFETSLQAAPWQQLLQDQQVYVLFSVIDKCGAGEGPALDSAMSFIDEHSAMLAKNFACSALLQLLTKTSERRAEVDMNALYPQQKSNLPQGMSSSKDADVMQSNPMQTNPLAVSRARLSYQSPSNKAPTTELKSRHSFSALKSTPLASPYDQPLANQSVRTEGNTPAEVTQTSVEEEQQLDQMEASMASEQVDPVLRIAVVSMCHNSRFMLCLESMAPCSLIAAKLLLWVFSWQEVNFNYSSPTFALLLYELINAYFGTAPHERPVAQGVPRVVLSMLVAAAKHSLNSARFIVSILPRDGVCSILKRIIDFHSKAYNDEEGFLQFLRTPEGRLCTKLYKNAATSMEELVDAVTVLHCFFDTKHQLQAPEGSQLTEWENHYTETEKSATISLCFGILDMLTEEEKRFRESNDIKHSTRSPRKSLSLSSPVHLNIIHDAGEGVETGDVDGPDLTDTFFKTDKAHEDRFEIDISSQIHSMWEALVTFTSLEYCTHGLLETSVLLDIVMSILLLSTEGAKCRKFNEGSHQVGARAGRIDDHIMLIKYCTTILSNITRFSEVLLVNYLSDGDKGGKNYTIGMTQYISYVHRNKLTLGHWSVHNICAEQLLGVLYSMSCIRVSYCESIIASSSLFLICLKENVIAAANLLHEQVAILSVVRAWRERRRSSSANTLRKPELLLSGLTTHMLETLLSLLGNLCRTYCGGHDILLYAADVLPALLPLIKDSTWRVLYKEGAQNPLSKVVRLTIVLCALLAPVFHRAELYLDLTEKLGGSPADSAEEATACAFNSRFAFIGGSSDLGGKHSEKSRSYREDYKLIENSTSNGDGVSLTLWDRAPFPPTECKRCVQLLPVILQCAIEALRAATGACLDTAVLGEATTIIIQLRSVRHVDASALSKSPATLLALVTAEFQLQQHIEDRLRAPRSATATEKELSMLLLLLYRVLHLIHGIAVLNGNPSSTSCLSGRLILKSILSIFCGSTAGTSASPTVRSVDWLPVMLQAGELLHLLVLDKRTQLVLRGLLGTIYKVRTITPASFTAGNTTYAHPILTGIATSINRVLYPMMHPPLK